MRKCFADTRLLLANTVTKHTYKDRNFPTYWKTCDVVTFTINFFVNVIVVGRYDAFTRS